MVNGPPTPPPTTSVELQEAAQASASAQEQGSTSQPAPLSSTNPDDYQRALPVIREAASRCDWDALISRAETVDVTATSGDSQPTRVLVVSPLVLAYLIQDKIPPARYALGRLPDDLSNLALVKLLASLTNLTSHRHHSRVYSTVTSLLELVGNPEFFDQEFGVLLTNLVTQFADAFRRRTFQLLSQAYSSLPLSLAQDYLGVSAEVIVNEANQYGWTHDPSTQLLFPKTHQTQEARRTSMSSLSTLHLVADSVARLEV
ncbi:hypothetical protein CC1G_01105 [Coprinopsis cinerea okayama7|uniref:CSN8/PSMD8/EIF3K domain-containing protein n=1 Tax=Coprinopsis cinerea (strain Okayama-7 / 130 / ATCC MYA-4618 / FGSC 9003) TaxID=240176 RepID=A8NEJ1_COPC7|nr:hypothetical protein CC1G_01105 [Coprinopsis cinerea okayama7\|eukprot:XP_001833043.2 hypothetical protein CC1G_01105 [Coprinopsis cinerea okayama7\